MAPIPVLSSLSEAEFRAIISAAAETNEPSLEPPWSDGLRRMLAAYDNLELRQGPASPLVKLCEAGARYGWQELEAAVKPSLLSSVSLKAKASLRRDLRRSLERLTRPCLELERTSFGFALNALGLAGESDSQTTDTIFLGDKPSHRLFSLFKKFPVLPRLWSQLITQWAEHATEVLVRFKKDRAALSRTFFSGQPVGPIINFRCSLSDPHNHGRTVMELQFAMGAVIYKPRSGEGEWGWASLLEWMNAQSFQPKLRAGRVLRRKGYCWMERIEAASCKSHAAAKRFYERMGGTIAAAYLLRAVDCHRENLIASGEYPVLVDADALLHVSPEIIGRTPLGLLQSTGFFPNSNPRSLQSRSSILGLTLTGKHVPRIGGRPLSAVQYEREIVKGFTRAWHCILATENRRETFARRLRRIQSRARRRLYGATEQYTAIKRASIQPSALRSAGERHLLMGRLCQRNAVAPRVIHGEIEALKGLDIPYFLRSSKERIPLDRGIILAELCEALRRV